MGNRPAVAAKGPRGVNMIISTCHSGGEGNHVDLRELRGGAEGIVRRETGKE
jgi:hypothetical protein